MNPRTRILCAHKAETILIEIFDHAAQTSFFANTAGVNSLKTGQVLKVCQQRMDGSDPAETTMTAATPDRSAPANGA